MFILNGIAYASKLVDCAPEYMYQNSYVYSSMQVLWSINKLDIDDRKLIESYGFVNIKDII
jgi:hypothetical protein